MRKFALFLSMILIFTLVSGCGGKTNNDSGKVSQGNEPPANGQVSGYQDGIYFAQDDQFAEKSGWKSIVIIKVESGKIVDVNWTAASRDGGPDKKTVSKEGNYGMVAFGKAQAEWHEQAAIMEQVLIDTQDPAAIKLKDDGTYDAVSGVSITVNEFTKLAEAALKAGPSEPGPYKDGAYYAEADEFAEKSGWKENVSLTVIHGQIVAVNWNAVHKDGGDDKKTSSIDGTYGMKAGGAQSEWHEQAAAAEAYLLKTQDPKAIPLKDDGKTDAISGVSVTVSGFTGLVEKALADAK